MGAGHDSIKVLLVDSDASAYAVVSKLLAEDSGLEVVWCDDPTVALDVALQQDATVILMDASASDNDPFMLLRFFRANNLTKDIPVLVLTLDEDPALHGAAFENGAHDFMRKFPGRTELATRIKGHAQRYLMQLERDAAFFALREMQKHLEKANAELHRMANTDPLTCVGNRRSFEDTLARAWSTATRSKSHISALLIDVDHFKLYNDTYGHRKGDSCLAAIAQCIQKTLRKAADYLGRYGGEEFVVLLPATTLSQAVHVAANIRNCIFELSIPHEASTTANVVTASIGVAALVATEGGDDELIELADKSLYKAKSAGRNRFAAIQLQSS